MIHRVRVHRGGRIVGGSAKHISHTRSHHLKLRGGAIHHDSHESNAEQLRKELTHLSVVNAPKERPKKYMAVKLGYRN